MRPCILYFLHSKKPGNIKKHFSRISQNFLNFPKKSCFRRYIGHRNFPGLAIQKTHQAFRIRRYQKIMSQKRNSIQPVKMPCVNGNPLVDSPALPGNRPFWNSHKQIHLFTVADKLQKPTFSLAQKTEPRIVQRRYHR